MHSGNAFRTHMSDPELEGDKIVDKRTVIHDLINYNLQSETSKWIIAI